MKNLLILITLVIGFSCTRKVHTEKTEDRSSDTRVINVDSVIEVNKTLSEAYEELLKTTNSTGVVFESQPCDTITKVINKITVAPDGTKTFEGNIKSFKEDATKYQSQVKWLEKSLDSLIHVWKTDSIAHEQSHTETIRTVKTTYIPLWMWVVLGIVGALWLNERLSLFKIPFITRTSLFTKNKLYD